MVLDTMASLNTPLDFSKIANLCKHNNPNLKDEFLREILDILSEDHYIERKEDSGENVYDFRWGIVKRWWKETRL